MQANILRDCLTELGGNPTLHQVDYIEIHPTHVDNREFLNNTCFQKWKMIYDQTKTEEQQEDACDLQKNFWMYPSFCPPNSWLECEEYQNCINKNFNGFYCKGKLGFVSLANMRCIFVKSVLGDLHFLSSNIAHYSSPLECDTSFPCPDSSLPACNDKGKCVGMKTLHYFQIYLLKVYSTIFLN